MSSALVAQGIEHGSPKAGVAGSNPAGGTSVLAVQRLFLPRLTCRVPSVCHPHSPARTTIGAATDVDGWVGPLEKSLSKEQACDPRAATAQLLLVVDDVNRSLLGGGCASVDTDVISQQVCVYVFAKPLVRRDKSTCPRASNLISLRKFGLPLGFVGALLFVLVERVIYPHGRIRLFLG